LQAQAKLDTFTDRAAMRIATVLAAAQTETTVLLATRLPEVRGYIDTLKKELCEDALRKRITKGLMGAASTPLQGFGHSAEQNLALVGRFEHHLAEKLNNVDEAAQKLLRRHLPQGGLRGRAIEAVLRTATKYEVSVGRVNGSVDMLRMIRHKSRVELTSDETQLIDLSEKLKKLPDIKESTASNWRETTEGWISVLELRGQLRVECGQSVLDCMVADQKVLEALGAAKAMMHIEGEAPPAALLTIIAEGPGAHIRKHGYRYTRRLDKELWRIRRIRELQTNLTNGVYIPLAVGTWFTIFSYLSGAMFAGAKDGFDKLPSMVWWLPFAVLGGAFVLWLLGLCICLCCCTRRSWRRLPLIAPIEYNALPEAV
tara:strand:+ start:1683 stop:2795 length:1113 start_codon:yes stop_codon:yes gene_type:complete